MKERPIIFSSPMVKAILDGRKTQTRRLIRNPDRFDNIRDCGFCCPYGQAGDRLWVRETWSMPESGGLDVSNHTDATILYAADGGRVNYMVSNADVCKWSDGVRRPSIHMPRWASRITLEVTDVRVERLCDINDAGAKAEGCHPDRRPIHAGWSYVASFCKLWDSINAKRAPWSSNPFVWVVEFRRC